MSYFVTIFYFKVNEDNMSNFFQLYPYQLSALLNLYHSQPLPFPYHRFPFHYPSTYASLQSPSKPFTALQSLKFRPEVPQLSFNYASFILFFRYPALSCFTLDYRSYY
eukprot:g27174.t1